MAEGNKTDQILRVVSPIAAICVPFILLWLTQSYNRQESMQAQINSQANELAALKNKYENVPQVVENALQRSELVRLREELKSANDNLKAAIQTHEQQQQSAPKGGKP